MLRDLPPEITIEPGRIEIVGADPISVLQNLYLLVLVMDRDLPSIQATLERVTLPRPAENDELKELFAQLREQEARYAAAKSASKTNWNCCNYVLGLSAVTKADSVLRRQPARLQSQTGGQGVGATGIPKRP